MRMIDADALTKELYIMTNSETGIVYTSDVRNLIDNAPTVTIKEWKEEMPDYIQRAMLDSLRPQGEWKFVKHGYYECSECEHLSYEIKSNFCPNCGSKMFRGNL